jgi:hypothetical protein
MCRKFLQELIHLRQRCFVCKVGINHFLNELWDC